MDVAWIPSTSFLLLMMRGVVVYIAAFTLMRLSGKKEIGEMGPAEFVAVLLISDALQNAMVGDDRSITSGVAMAAILVGMSAIIRYVTWRWRKAADILDGAPELLVYRGRPMEEPLRRNRISMHEFRSMLRQKGIVRMSDVREAVLEPDGALSVVKYSDLKHRETA
jgi:uncharacterized membrane protein YcaP (DUF421 family)